MTFGGDSDEAVSAALFTRAREVGSVTDRTEHLAGFGDAPGAGDPGDPSIARPR
jgi:hypothetical protein